MMNNYFRMIKKLKIVMKVVNQKEKEKLRHSTNFGEIIIKILN
jgi:hypothetical protein